MDHTISIARANALSIPLTLQVVGLVPGAYVLFHVAPGWIELDAILGSYLLLIAVLAVSALAHELLHALGFRLAGRVPWRAIRLGIHWRLLTPFASTNQPMTATAYRWSAALPGVVLGVLPAVAGLATGSLGSTPYGAMMMAGAAGDAAAPWTMRRVPGTAMVQDAKDRVGCIVLLPQP